MQRLSAGELHQAAQRRMVGGANGATKWPRGYSELGFLLDPGGFEPPTFRMRIVGAASEALSGWFNRVLIFIRALAAYRHLGTLRFAKDRAFN